MSDYDTTEASAELKRLLQKIINLETDNKYINSENIALRGAIEEAKPIIEHAANRQACWGMAALWQKKYGGTK